MQFKVNPLKKNILFNDFNSGMVSNVRAKWKKRPLYKPNSSTKIKLYGKHIYAPLSFDRFYYKKYQFVGGIGGYTIYYCHYKYRDDYVFVTLQHKVVKGKSDNKIYDDTIIFLDSMGIDTTLLELDDKVNRIDLKRDAEASNQTQIDAFLNAISKSRDSFNKIDKICYTTAIKYKPKGSSTEVIVYNKWAEMNSRAKKRSHTDLDIYCYENVIRTELRLKSKRLYNNTKNKRHLSKNLSTYFNEDVIDEHFKSFVEPIFYTESFYRIDYAIIEIMNNYTLTQLEKEKLCYLVTEINKKGYSKAKKTYKYCDDSFEKHIKLLRSIGVNPLTFDKNIDIGIVPNFTLKENCRDYEGDEQYM